MIHYVKGDLLTDNYEVFCHQVNCQHVMGGGLAKQVRAKYPEVYDTYQERKLQYLGAIDWVPTNDGRICVNMYAQDDYGYGARYTDYIAFAACLIELTNYLVTEPENYKVAFPYGIGCGLGSGSWHVIEALIEDFEKMIKQEVYIVKKE